MPGIVFVEKLRKNFRIISNEKSSLKETPSSMGRVQDSRSRGQRFESQLGQDSPKVFTFLDAEGILERNPRDRHQV